jgi:L-gulonolactone oxidase
LIRVRNYGKTWTFRPSELRYPQSAEELRALVASAKKVRVMGSRHSWSKSIVTDGTLVSLDRMNRLVSVDKENLRVTVQAGIKLRDLNARLEQHGLALANLGSIDDQSLAGAISTGTHGTGMAFQCLAAQVESLELIDGGGQDRHLDKSDPALSAVAVGLGCFGIIHEMTFAVVPSFQIHAITDTARFDDVIENLDDYVTGYDHFKFWWLVPEDTVIVFMNRRTDLPCDDSDLTRWFRDDVLSVVGHRSLVALAKLDRKRLVPAFNRIQGRMIGKRFERICKSRVGFLTPTPPVHRETEWAFDYAHSKELLTKYRELLSKSGHTYNFVQEIRFTKADEFWLSPAFGRDSIWLSMYNMDNPRNWDHQLTQFQAFAEAHGGRPHWGKEAAFDSGYLKVVWPKLGEFCELMKEYDPNGKFVNAWVDQIFSRWIEEGGLGASGGPRG